MSIISNRHTILPFVAGTSTAFEGQRLAKCGYKSTAKNPAKYPSICVSIPKIDIPFTEEQITKLQDHIVSLVENVQDQILRSLYESSDGTLKELSDADISFDAVIGYLDSESSGGHLTKEKITRWFTSTVQDNLTVYVAEKLGFDLSAPEQEETVSRHVNGYKELFVILAGKSVILQDTQIRGLRKAIEISSGDVSDDMSVKLDKKLIEMSNKPKMAELLEL